MRRKSEYTAELGRMLNQAMENTKLMELAQRCQYQTMIALILSRLPLVGLEGDDFEPVEERSEPIQSLFHLQHVLGRLVAALDRTMEAVPLVAPEGNWLGAMVVSATDRADFARLVGAPVDYRYPMGEE
jgi:hypothetical protein